MAGEPIRQILRFEPPTPQSCMIHVYLKGAAGLLFDRFDALYISLLLLFPFVFWRDRPALPGKFLRIEALYYPHISTDRVHCSNQLAGCLLFLKQRDLRIDSFLWGHPQSACRVCEKCLQMNILGRTCAQHSTWEGSSKLPPEAMESIAWPSCEEKHVQNISDCFRSPSRVDLVWSNAWYCTAFATKKRIGLLTSLVPRFLLAQFALQTVRTRGFVWWRSQSG